MSLFKRNLLHTSSTISNEVHERNYLFDNISALLILLVVIAHVIDLTNFSSQLSKTIYFSIYFFHMPVFIFISGFFSKNVEKCRDTAMARYFIPYILLVVFSFLHVKFLASSDEETLTLFRLFTPTTGCWYLFATFVWKTFIKDLAKIRYSIPLFFAFGLLTGFTHEFGYKLSLGRICTLTVFFLLGYYTEVKHIKRIKEFPNIFSIPIVLVLIGISYYYANILEIAPSTLHVSSFYKSTPIFKDFILRLIYYVLASSMVFVLINLFSDKKKWFSIIGANSVTVYIIHLFIVRRIDLIFPNIKIFHTNDFVYILTVIILSLIVTLVFSNKIFVLLYTKLIGFINQLLFTNKSP